MLMKITCRSLGIYQVNGQRTWVMLLPYQKVNSTHCIVLLDLVQLFYNQEKDLENWGVINQSYSTCYYGCPAWLNGINILPWYDEIKCCTF